MKNTKKRIYKKNLLIMKGIYLWLVFLVNGVPCFFYKKICMLLKSKGDKIMLL